MEKPPGRLQNDSSSRLSVCSSRPKMNTCTSSPPPQLKAGLTLLPAEMKLLIIDHIDYCDLPSFRATCREFWNLIALATLDKRKTLKRSELRSQEINMREIIQRMKNKEPQRKEIFATPHIGDHNASYVSILKNFHLHCYWCLRARPIARFPIIWWIVTFGKQSLLGCGRCTKYTHNDLDDKDYASCVRCGSIASFLFFNDAYESYDIVDDESEGWETKRNMLILPPIFRSGLLTSNPRTVLCAVCQMSDRYASDEKTESYCQTSKTSQASERGGWTLPRPRCCDQTFSHPSV